MEFKINNDVKEKDGYPGYTYSMISIKKINQKTLVDIVLCKIENNKSYGVEWKHEEFNIKRIIKNKIKNGI
jgi:hypothetical protein